MSTWYVRTQPATASGVRLGAFTLEADSLTSALTLLALDDIDAEAITVTRAGANLHPEVLTFGQIAELLGVSRQRARTLPKIDGFPLPYLDTSNGPVFEKDAVVAWAQDWERSPARRNQS